MHCPNLGTEISDANSIPLSPAFRIIIKLTSIGNYITCSYNKANSIHRGGWLP